jgi:uncharacterized membrane protein
MAFCQNCGSPVDGRFCAKCGAASGQTGGAQTAYTSGPTPGTSTSGLADNVASALCYIPIVGIIFLLVAPYNRNRLIRFHAFQSLFLVLAMFVVNIILSSLFEIFFGAWALFGLVRLVFFAAWIYLVIKAYNGDKVLLPVIGPLAEKQA